MPVDKPLTLGPFTGGMNTMSDPTDVDDKQCVEALNFDQDPNGSMKSRPPFTSAGSSMPLSATGDARVLGFFYNTDGTPYLIGSDGSSKTYRFSAGTWTLITDTFAAAAFVQFDGKAWLIAPPNATNPGGRWTPAGGFVAEANMPKGRSAAVYKDRIWIATGAGSTGPTSMFYSRLIVEGPIWDSVASREVQVSPGDGQTIVALQPYFGQLLVFRNQSIYSYSYASSTAAATISVVTPGIGLANSDAIVAYESYLYFMYDDKAYEFVQARAQRINQQVPFRASNQFSVARPFSVSTFGRRILFSYYDYVYVFNVDTRTWTRWQSDVWGPIGSVLEPIPGTSPIDAFALPSKSVAPLAGVVLTDGWDSSSATVTAEANTTRTVSSINPRTGPNALIMYRSTGAGIAAGTRLVTGLTIGREYTATVWANLATNSITQVKLGVVGIGETAGITISTAGYQQLTYVFTATATSHQIRLSHSASVAGTSYAARWDDLSVAETGGRACPTLKINEALNASDAEAFTCTLQTKNYSYDLPSNFKRMFWWGVDAVFRQQVRGEAHPIVQTQSVTWRDLYDRVLTWADLLTSSWDAPVGSDQIAEITNYNLDGLGFQRKFAKFKKAMRFRQVYFRVSFTADGTINTSPVYVFTLRARLSVRQTVSKAIS